MKKRLLKVIAVVLCMVLAMPAVACTPKLVYTGKALADGRAGLPYEAQINTATGAKAGVTVSYSLKEAEGKLPDGLTLSADGKISGTTQQTGDFSFTIIASAEKYTSAEAKFTLKITAKLNFSYNPGAPEGGTPLDGGIVNVAYPATNIATATGTGTETITYAIKAVQGSNLPLGLTLSPAGVISGTPTATYNDGFIVIASAAGYNDAETRFTLSIVLPTVVFPTSALAGGKVGIEYKGASGATASVANVTTPSAGVSYMVYSGDLPKGLELSSAGAITGKPEEAGTFNFTIRASAPPNYNPADAEFAIEIVQLALSYSSSALPGGQITVEYKDGEGETVSVATATAPEGRPAIAYTRIGGSLPTGLTLNSYGTITGTQTFL